MSKKPVRVAVTGAAGQIGYALLFRIASGEMLGKDQPVILQLLEIPDEKAQKALKGVMMELQDCAFPLLAGMQAHSDPMTAFKDADYALLVGARLRGPGLRQLLGALADTARSELDMRQRVSASRAGTRRSAQIVVIFSIVVMLGLAVFNRSFVAPYSSVQGQLVLVVVVLLFAVGMLWMRHLAGVQLPRRFLTVAARAGGEDA